MKKTSIKSNRPLFGSAIKALSGRRSILLVSISPVLLFLMFSWSSGGRRDATGRYSLYTAEDTLPQAKTDEKAERQVTSTIYATVEGNKYRVLTLNNQPTSLFINDKKVPDERIGDYKNVTDKIIEDFNEHSIKPVKPSGKGVIKAVPPATDISPTTDISGSGSKTVIVMPVEKKGEIKSQEAEQQKQQSLEHAKQVNSQIEDLQQKIITDLISENAIKSKAGLSFKLTDEELTVNGVKQPEALYKKLKDKYVKGRGWQIMYEYKDQ